jgi:hypothetical protein
MPEKLLTVFRIEENTILSFYSAFWKSTALIRQVRDSTHSSFSSHELFNTHSQNILHFINVLLCVCVKQ